MTRAALLSVDGIIVLGCTVGQAVIGMSTLALDSLLAWLAILMGSYLSMKYLEEGSLTGALRAALQRN